MLKWTVCGPWPGPVTVRLLAAGKSPSEIKAWLSLATQAQAQAQATYAVVVTC